MSELALNLVRSSAYQECGGCEALRLTVVDDIKLGLLLRQSGKRTRGFLGAAEVECHWFSTVAGMVRSACRSCSRSLCMRSSIRPS